MPSMITEIEDYFDKGCGRCDRYATVDCATRRWNDGLRRLRSICLDAGLEETVKWGHPCYVHAGRNIAIIGAFRDDFRLTFFNASLLKDPDGVLDRKGAHGQRPELIRFTDNDQPDVQAQIIGAYLAEAKSYAEQGIRPARDDTMPDAPEELTAALDADPELAEAFDALTPGRRKSYVLNLNGARKPETRVARIAKFRDKIMAGKGALDR